MHIRLMVTAASAAFAMASSPAQSQDATTQPQADTSVAVPGEGVTVFEAAYFAGVQLNSAMDMIERVPGFSFDDGDNVRGLGGTAANVLIDGRRRRPSPIRCRTPCGASRPARCCGWS